MKINKSEKSLHSIECESVEQERREVLKLTRQTHFSLSRSLVTVTFYKVAMNTESANMRPLLLREIQVWIPTNLWLKPFHRCIST